jgi:hypothetical protein
LRDHEGSVDRVVQVTGYPRRLLFIAGAGMHAISGLPTYRDRDGLYRADQTTPHGLSIEQVLHQGNVIVADATAQVLFSIDPLTGNRSILSENGLNCGVPINLLDIGVASYPISTVTEPASLLLLGLGIIGMVTLGGRRVASR